MHEASSITMTHLRAEQAKATNVPVALYAPIAQSLLTIRSTWAVKGGEKEERLTAWNIISVKLISPCPHSECTSTVWTVGYTHAKYGQLSVCITDHP